ncbi:MAG: hypothetical protein FJX65_13785 [Alphaproteobacteria bacterium]|nr:hypothetical protein [Alphaproteobacteria bacterium]
MSTHTTRSFSRFVTRALPAALFLSTVAFGAQAQEKVLRVGATQMPPSKANTLEGTGTPGSVLWVALFDTFTELDAKSVAQPMVAESWAFANGAWRFKVRPNVKFWNGNAVTAQAAADIINYLLTEEGRRTNTSNHLRVAGITGAKVIDAMTVQVDTASPSPLIPAYMAVLPAIDIKYLTDGGATNFSTNPMGTGAFKIEAWTPNGVRIRSTKAYWKGSPKVDVIDYTEIPDSTARVGALITGQIDIDNATQPDVIPQIKAARGNVDIGQTARVHGISFVAAPIADGRGEKSRFRDQRIRMAANLAVNKQAMLDNLFSGVGTIGSQAGTSSSYGFNPNVKPYPYDPARAKQLLAEAGFPNGFDFVIEARVDDPIQKVMFEVAVNDMAKVGMRAQLLPITFATQLKNFSSGTWAGEAFGIGHFVAPTMDVTATFRLASCLKTPEVSVYYCNREEADMVLAANREFDQQKRLAILHKLMELNHNNAPLLTMLELPSIMGYGPRVRNLKTLNENINYFDIDVVN